MEAGRPRVKIRGGSQAWRHAPPAWVDVLTAGHEPAMARAQAETCGRVAFGGENQAEAWARRPVMTARSWSVRATGVPPRISSAKPSFGVMMVRQ